MYLDNGNQFVAKEFKAELAKHRIKPIHGRPYHPRGRGQDRELPQDPVGGLVSQTRFSSLDHFKSELKKFDRRYNHWRKSQALGWKTPASIYNDRRYFNKKRRQV
jgi:putative transposase